VVFVRLGFGLRRLLAGCVLRVATCHVITTDNRMTPTKPTIKAKFILSKEKELDEELVELLVVLELLFVLAAGAGLTVGKLSTDNWGVAIS
jgi:hypothetical protein